MPRYFFHTQLGADTIEDPVGTDLPDPDAAWERARDTIRAALRDARDQTRLMGACMVVADADGEVVLEFPFGEAVIGPDADPTRH